MDPLVDEYNSKSATKGTELAALQIAEQKAQAFTRKMFYWSFVFLGIEIVQKWVSM